MANIRPFQAIRPRKGLEERIAALPYDVYNSAEARREVEKEPFSFLKIDRAETSFTEEFLFENKINIYDDLIYNAAHDILWEQINNQNFIKESKECFYLYRQTMNNRTQTGLVACASIDDYQAEIIKKHEKTREEKEIDRIRHVDTCDAQTGPIFLAYRTDSKIQDITREVVLSNPIYDFISSDGIRHQVWLIEQEEKIVAIQNIFKEMNSIYIADGHHRCASAVKVGMMRRKNNPDYTGEEPYNFFLSVLFPDEELMIMDYNRVVKDLNGFSKEEFLQKIEPDFEVQTKGNMACRPEKKGQFGMYLEGTWYQLNARNHLFSDDPVANLDVSILQDHLLSSLLGIGDPKIDKRIDFVGGIRGLEELERRVSEDMKIAFSMYPTSIQELFDVADAGKLMPPKSTWFEPKLRSGLFIHSLK